MKHNRRANRFDDRTAGIFRDSRKAGGPRPAGGRASTFIAENPLLSTCLGLAGGFALGLLIRRGS